MAKIFCFSSTGNSLHIAKTMAKSLRAEVISMSGKPGICSDDLIGFVFPTYYLGMPVSVKQYISKLEITNKEAYVFAVVSYGGKVFGVLGQVEQLLRTKGLTLQYGKYIKSVENYLPLYTVNNQDEVHRQQDEEIGKACAQIVAREKINRERASVLDKIAYLSFPGRNGNNDRYFVVSSACTGCGVCAGICPRENIELQQGRPVFLHQCEHCIACMHACPSQAINWKKSTQAKERYRNPNVGAKELADFCGKKSR